MSDIKSPKKLIEVALPLDDINREAAREKSIRHGHPSTLHLWWARRPLAAARAVLFAQMVNDPGYQQGGGFKYGVNKIDAARRREELFDIIRELVKWENTNNEAVLERARAEIRKSWREVCELNQDHPQASAPAQAQTEAVAQIQLDLPATPRLWSVSRQLDPVGEGRGDSIRIGAGG
ncbi:MAG TPA: DUF1156 domain-containing protein, partial [Gammaproteobacteria bacterium]|nr:DUF1156 domain-containing protein [Gammaproteobacteria bacterium]